jgi:hypothetical protein
MIHFVASLRQRKSLESGQNSTQMQQMQFLLDITNFLAYVSRRLQPLTAFASNAASCASPRKYGQRGQWAKLVSRVAGATRWTWFASKRTLGRKHAGASHVRRRHRWRSDATRAWTLFTWRVSPPVALLNDVPLSCLCRLRRRQEKTDPLACLHVMKGSHAQF